MPLRCVVGGWHPRAARACRHARRDTKAHTQAKKSDTRTHINTKTSNTRTHINTHAQHTNKEVPARRPHPSTRRHLRRATELFAWLWLAALLWDESPQIEAHPIEDPAQKRLLGPPGPTTARGQQESPKGGAGSASLPACSLGRQIYYRLGHTYLRRKAPTNEQEN